MWPACHQLSGPGASRCSRSFRAASICCWGALAVPQITQQLPLLVGRVMAEGSLYDPELAALALKQALGDPIEAVFLLRAYSTTLPRLAYTEPLGTRAMRVQRRVSAIFKDV